MDNLLKCPSCHGPLKKALPRYFCSSCGRIISTVGSGVPVFNEKDVYKFTRPKNPHRQLLQILKKLPPSAKILNLSPEIATIKKFHHGIINLRCEQGAETDIIASPTELPFLAKSFDLVISQDLTDIHPGYKLILAQVYRVLKEGGLFFITSAKADFFHDNFSDYHLLDSGIARLGCKFWRLFVPSSKSDVILNKSPFLARMSFSLYGVYQKPHQ